MSTRATYQFVSDNDPVSTKTFYLHYDGYPEGGAKYFASSAKCQSSVGNLDGYQLQEDFILNHNPSEIEDHAEHGDTEFRYTFNRTTLNILVEKRVGSLPWDFDNYFDGTLTDFIEQETNMAIPFNAINERKYDTYESTDYFYKMCDARGELAGTKVVLESLIEALEVGDNPIMTAVALSTAKQKIVDINNELSKDIHS
tara:strand:+ start:697 stop:1293 length:597 start_codon:yes stop_codon:yes gene_type:complete